ncbi:MAG: lipid A biosynthesis acyltransferase, partial [Pseudomonadota bacterium]|nr:lipid A biosynthesis acyltransferase [Pseudomonadota bacterium]
MSKPKRTPKHVAEFQKRYFASKYWGIWLGLGLLRLLAFVPYRWKFSIGKSLGRVLYSLAPKRRRLALANLKLCFPEKTDKEHQRLLKNHFDSLGISLMEMALVWWGDHKTDHEHAFERSIVSFIGEDNLKQAQETGKGVLILAPHFTTLELTGLFVSFLTNYHAVYRPHDNPFMDYIIAKG